MRTVELPTVATPDQVQQQQQQQQQQLPFSVETAGALTTYGLSFVRGLFERPRANGSAADSAANADATSFSSVGSLHRHARETLSQLVARADALQETTSPLARWLNASGVTLAFQRDALSDSVVFESVTLQLPLRSEYLQRRLSLRRRRDGERWRTTTPSEVTGSWTSTSRTSAATRVPRESPRSRRHGGARGGRRAGPRGGDLPQLRRVVR
ncbi:hypothetical protein PINS_up015235 [Pythium insidiosum]|nr:hypothetical protein PINS_up015235 [Pythium insidiosum]